MSARNLPVLLVLLFSCGGPAAQQSDRESSPAPSAGTPTIRAISESVVLDVVVRDKSGRPVRDLKLEEIEIYENGLRQTLHSFRFVGDRSEDAAAAEAAPGPDPGIVVQTETDDRNAGFNPFRHVNLVALVFERLPDTARHTARQSALHLLETGLPDNTLVAVFAVDNRLWLLQQFTPDRQLARDAIMGATSGAYGEFASQSQATIEGELRTTSRQLTRDPSQDLLLGARSETPSVAEIQEGALAEVTMNVLRHAQQLMRYQRGHLSVSALQALVHEQAKLAGRKTLVLFSAGFEIPPEVVSRFRLLISEANRANVSVYAVDARGLTPEDELGSAKYLFNQAVEASRRQQLTGLGRMVTREETMIADWAETSIRMNRQGTLDDLARSTGGFLVANTNDARSAIERVSEDIRTYYEVAYTPTDLQYDGKFREISVKINRPNVRVQSRSGYFAVPPGDESPILPYEIPMLVALNSGSLPHQFEHHNRVLRFEERPDGIEYVFVIEVPLASFSFVENSEQQTYDTRFSLLLLIKDKNDQVIRKFVQDYPLQGPLNKISVVRSGSVVFMRNLPLSPGRYILESAVVDQLSERVSTRRTRLLVRTPSSSGPRMSSLSVIRRVDPLDPDAGKADPLHYQEGRIVPNLSGEILQETDAEIGLYCIVYPDPHIAEVPELTLEILRDGQVVAQGTRSLSLPEAEGEIKFVGTIPVDGLSPGRYEVRAWVFQGDVGFREHAFFSLADRRAAKEPDF